MNPFRWLAKAASSAISWTKSLGEKKLLQVFPSWTYGGIWSSWNTTRLELANHYRGWSYVAIKAISEEIAGDPPVVAYRRNPDEMQERQEKAMRRVRGKSYLEQQSVLRAFRKKFASQQVRRKALTPVLDHEDLELADNDDRLHRLLQNPNEPDTAFTFLHKLAMFFELFGECYIWKVRNRIPSAIYDGRGQPAELWVLPTHWVIPRPDPDGKRLIGFYEVRPLAGYVPGVDGFGWFAGGGGSMRVDPEDIIPILAPHPNNFIGGYSSLTAVAEWIQCGESIDGSRVAQFQNAAMPGVVVQLDKDLKEPSQDTIDKLKARIEENYVGVRRTGKPIVLSPGVTMAPITHAPNEMDYTGSGDQLKSWILAAHRVGQSIVGLAENTNFASMVAARANFQTSKIRPFRLMLGQVLTEKLAREFDEDAVIFFKDKTPDDPAQKLAEWNAMADRGVVTPNEFRKEYGLEPYEFGGDDPMVGGMVQPWATGQQPIGQGLADMFGQQQPPEQEQTEEKGQPGPVNRLPSLNGLNGKHVGAN